MLAGSAAVAEEPLGVPAPDLQAIHQGQVILNPEPDYSAPSPVQRTLDELANLAPAAGPADAAATGDCPQPGAAWEVVVIRGGQAPEVVRPHVIQVLPGC
jgi:hypothetical protein